MKPPHGGKRPGAGRKPIPPTERVYLYAALTLTPAQAEHADTLRRPGETRRGRVRRVVLAAEPAADAAKEST